MGVEGKTFRKGKKSQGPVQCRDKVQTVVVDNPIEECDMEPIRTCK